MISGGSLLGACAREEKDAVVMFVSRGAQCESVVVVHKDRLRLVQENVALMKETMNGLNTSHLTMESYLVDCTGKNW